MVDKLYRIVSMAVSQKTYTVIIPNFAVNSNFKNKMVGIWQFLTI